MKYIEFCEMVKSDVQATIGEEYIVRLIKVEKLNGLLLQSIAILNKDQMTSPNIYLESYYSEFQIGKTIRSIVSDIITLFYKAGNQTEISASFILDFSLVKNKIYFKLINYERNQEFLKNVPHRKWLDLAVIYSVLIKKDAQGIGSVTIKNDMLESWDVHTEAIEACAKINTPLLFEASVKPMEDIIKHLLVEEFDEMQESEDASELIEMFNGEQSSKQTAMYVGTNNQGVNGAALLLYPNALRDFSDKVNLDIIILPSSIHEVLLIPLRGDMNKEDLYRMVKDVNETQVSLEDYLATNVYMYVQELGEVRALF